MKKKYRISFTTKKVREEQERKKLEPKHKIVITRPHKKSKKKSSDGHRMDYGVVDEAVRIPRSELVSKCWQEFNDVKLERNKLSSQTWKLVQDGATQEQLKTHYEKIESYRKQLTEIFDKARHAEQYGELPHVNKEDNGQRSDLASLKYEKKKLTEKRSKLRKKIELGKATNAPKLSEWELELDQADAEYNILDDKIKEMEGA
jgi:hypothetical protein